MKELQEYMQYNAAAWMCPEKVIKLWHILIPFAENLQSAHAYFFVRVKRSVLPRAIIALGLFTLHGLTTNSRRSAFYVERSNSISMHKVFFDRKKGLVGIKPKRPLHLR